MIVGPRGRCLAYWGGFLIYTLNSARSAARCRGSHRLAGIPDAGKLRDAHNKGVDLSYRTEFPRARLYAALMALVASAVMAQTPALIVLDAWVRQVPGSDVAAAYLTLRNPTAKPITVMSIESPVAENAMIHETKTVGGQSQMRPHEQLVIAPGETVKFEPGGLHVMLMGVKQAAAVGESIPLVLVLADGTRVQVAAVVRPLSVQ